MAGGQQTKGQGQALGYHEVLLRSYPRLSWTDSHGAHEVVVDARMVLGTASGTDLTLPEATVSRLHAELEPRDTGLWVRDLGSRNGTFVGGIRVESACVPEGGRIGVGTIEMTVRYGREATAVPLWSEARFGSLVGGSAPMREMFHRLARFACNDATVLVQGETGTGKELVVRAIHDASARAGGPLVVVDCGALPESLLDAELFGHNRGAFTGATAARAGAFEAANGGTLFLDEVGELPMALQPKLLRVLEARTVRRLGENEQRPVDVRFISATHRDLRTMVNARAFREDLYFRLAVLPVTIPPLRERSEDVMLLARHFLPVEHHGLLTPELRAEMEERPWLGNVRELRNFIERLTTLGAREALAFAAAAPDVGGAPNDWFSADKIVKLTFREARDHGLARIEKIYLAALLERHGRNVTAAAEAAGLNRTYLHRLIRRYGL